MTTNLLPILYSFRRCPYAMRARMALTLIQCKVELREVVLKNKPASLLSFSPKGTVPILVLPNGLVLDESLEIINWAISQNSTIIAPPDPKQLILIKHNDNEFKTALDRYKYFDRFPEHNQAYYRHQGEKFLELLEQMLTQAHSSCNDDSLPRETFLYGNDISYADIAIFPFIRQFSHVDKVWFKQANYPYLKNWLNFFLTSESFLMVMTKFSPWHQAHPITLFPVCD